MGTPGTHSALRLVGGGVAPRQRALPLSHVGPSRSGPALAVSSAPAISGRERRAASHQIESENKAASMSALDPRWALAVRANSLLQGGRAAVLPPESRRLLVGIGRDLKLRPFDANLIIAVVQDAARAGMDPLGVEARTRLKMVPEPRVSQDPTMLRWLIGAGVLGMLGAWFLIRAFGS